jgi:ATP-dependent Clp protease protease subunit
MLRQPNIIKETNRGFDAFTIQDEMLMHREIECLGEINDEMICSLISQIMYLKRQNENEKITIYINSPGGSVDSGLALLDIMKAVKCPIRTVCIGMAASMGAVLFLAGDERDILPHSRVMIHDPLIGGGGLKGSALQIESRVQDLMKTREVLAEIIAAHTGKSLTEIYEKTGKDSYFYADEAVEFGLADKIITEI